MFRDFEEEAMSGEKQIFVDVAMVIKTMLLNPGRFLRTKSPVRALQTIRLIEVPRIE